MSGPPDRSAAVRGPRRAQRAATGAGSQAPAPEAVAGRAADDTDLGWGEAPEAARAGDDERYLRERPPHW